VINYSCHNLDRRTITYDYCGHGQCHPKVMHRAVLAGLQARKNPLPWLPPPASMLVPGQTPEYDGHDTTRHGTTRHDITFPQNHKIAESHGRTMEESQFTAHTVLSTQTRNPRGTRILRRAPVAGGSDIQTTSTHSSSTPTFPFLMLNRLSGHPAEVKTLTPSPSPLP
jgi:hypothetical protein